jgi:hypothetical protein
MAKGTIFKKPETRKEYENPEVLIQGYGRMNLDTLKKKIEKDHVAAVRFLKMGSYDNYEYAMNQISEFVEAVMDVEQEMSRPRYKRLKSRLQEEPANSAGGGGVAGIGVGPDGEPGVSRRASNKYKRRNQKDIRKFINRKTMNLKLGE